MSSRPRKWKFRLRHMQEAVEKIRKYAAGKTKDDFRSDPMALDAIVWNLMVLGEAARQVPDQVVEAYPQIPWPQIRGTRNRIVHGYDQIDLDIVWNVVRHELEPLKEPLEKIMQEAED